MIIIQGYSEGVLVAEEQLADKDEQFASAIADELYETGCDYVEVIQG